VHRALISALRFGDDGQTEEEAARLHDIAEHISMTERRSMAAERDATSRYIASFLADRVGASFEGKISGVTRFGLFIRLDETQADGLAPISSLGRERWRHDEAAHALVGEESGRRYPLGMRVEVRLEEAAPVSGGLIFTMLSEPLAPAPGFKRVRKSKQGFDRPRGKRRRK
jgi:ribonuclease R